MLLAICQRVTFFGRKTYRRDRNATSTAHLLQEIIISNKAIFVWHGRTYDKETAHSFECRLDS